MSIFVPRLLKEIIEKEKELPKKIASVCDYYNLSKSYTNSCTKNCSLAIDNYSSFVYENVKFNKYKPVHKLLTSLLKDFDQIKSIDNEMVAKKLISFLCDFFFNRLTGFKGNKKMLFDFVDETQEIFNKCIDLGIVIKQESSEYRSYEEIILDLKKQYDDVEKQPVKRGIDEKHANDEKERIRRALAKNEKRRKGSSDIITSNTNLIEDRIFNFKNRFNDLVGVLATDSGLIEEEIATDEEVSSMLANNEQLRNKAYGSGEDLVESKAPIKQEEVVEQETVEASISILSLEDKEWLEGMLEDKINKSLKENNIATKGDVEESTKEIKASIDAQTEELKKKIDEASKLDVQELVSKLADLYKKEAKEPEKSTEQQLIPLVGALNEKGISVKTVVESLLNDNPPYFVGAAAYLRCLIDSYVKYGCGIEMNANQHIFKESGTKDALLNAFGNHGNRVKRINDSLNLYIHNSVKFLSKSDEDKRSELIDAANFLTQTAGIDFTKIDYVAGVKKLYEAELNDINKLASGVYNLNDLFISNSMKKKQDETNEGYYQRLINNLYLFATNRLVDYKAFLLFSNVDESYFDSLGEPATKEEIVIPQLPQ